MFKAVRRIAWICDQSLDKSLSRVGCSIDQFPWSHVNHFHGGVASGVPLNRERVSGLKHFQQERVNRLRLAFRAINSSESVSLDPFFPMGNGTSAWFSQMFL
jgi:hypothetical protein